MGKPVRIEEDNTVELDTSEQLADGIKEIEKLQNSLIKRERELAVLEERLKKENDELRKKFSDENDKRIIAVNEKEKATKQLAKEISSAYSFIHTIISGSFCREIEYIKNIGFNRWLDIDEFYHELGKRKVMMKM